MGRRFSILRPLTVEEQQIFAIELCNFFTPLNYKKNCQLLGITPDPNSIRPLSLGNFFTYLKKVRTIDGYKYQYAIRNIIHKFIEESLFVDAGNGLKGSPPYNKCYYAQFELTERQKVNLFWLGRILGESFLMEKYKPFIVRFEGVYTNNESGTGSGVLISEDTILTCRHNLTDLKEYSCFLKENQLEVGSHKYHSIHDIGIVKLKTPVKLDHFPYFGEPHELDPTLTMGFPPLRGMREAALISQKGEINAKSIDWYNANCITISSTVRPGNSGGPVISKNGYIVGIVTQYANSASSVSVDKNAFKDNASIPFYNAIDSTTIITVLEELDKSIPILYENYE